MTGSPEHAGCCCPEPEGGLVDFGDDRLDHIQRLVRAVTFNLLLDTGRPADREVIARRAGVSVDVTERVLDGFGERGSFQVDAADRVVGIAGLSVEPTRHRISLRQGIRWTWCALDAVGIVAAVGSGRIASTSRGGRFEITYGVDGFEPSHLAVFLANGYGMSSSIEEWCPLVDFFPTVGAADRWAAQQQVRGKAAPIGDIATLAADRWRRVIEGR